MFEDEVDEVGSDVESYCPKCKGDTTHVVISKYEDEIRRVQCNPCGDVHSFRKPRGDVEADHHTPPGQPVERHQPREHPHHQVRVVVLRAGLAPFSRDRRSA